MRPAAAFALLMMVACSSSSNAARVSPSPPATASRVASSPSPFPSPSASVKSSPGPTPFVLTLPDPVAPPSVAAGQCALPVYWGNQAGTQSAFVVYPTGAVLRQGAIASAHGATYDAAVGRWLPVGPEAVSPDGLQLAYADYDLPDGPGLAGMAGGGVHTAGTLATSGRVHVMDARTGLDRIVYSGSPAYKVVGFTDDGVYLAQLGITQDGQFSSGLFLLRVMGGAAARVLGGDRAVDRLGWTIADGAAWATEYAAGAGGLTSGNELVRLNLVTGDTTVMLTKSAGVALELLGFDGEGNALVSLTANGESTSSSPPPPFPPQLVTVTDPQVSKVLWEAPDNAIQPPLAPASADTHGVWMGGQSSVWLDAHDTISQTFLPSFGSAVFPGGRCV